MLFHFSLSSSTILLVKEVSWPKMSGRELGSSYYEDSFIAPFVGEYRTFLTVTGLQDRLLLGELPFDVENLG